MYYHSRTLDKSGLASFVVYFHTIITYSLPRFTMDATHNINAFKTEYPLSPKKFWKKMIGTIVGSICWTILIAIVVTGLIEPNDAAEAITLNIIKIFEFSLLAFTFAYVLIRVWYWRAYIRSYFYDGSGDFLTIRKGVFMPTEIHVQWPKIQDVYVDQDIFDRIMGLYDVHIASATVTSGTEAHIDGVDGATMESLKTYLLGRVSGIQTRSTNPASPLAAPAPTTFKLSEPISSKQFPISDTFAFIKILGMFFPNILFGLWIFF